MTEALISVHLSGALLEDVSQEADRSGLTVEGWLVWLAAERMREKEAAERFFSRAPEESDGRRFLEILGSTKDNAPMAGDEWQG